MLKKRQRPPTEVELPEQLEYDEWGFVKRKRKRKNMN
jgi:hypothetical protein